MSIVPRGWRTSRLSRHVQILGGRDYSDVADDDGPFPVYGSGGQFASACTPLYEGEGALFGRKGTVDQPRFLQGSFWIADTAYFVKPVGDDIDPRFLYYWACRFPFGLYMTDTALPSMTSAAIGSESILLPPTAQQRTIVDYLDHETAEIDAFVADLEHARALLVERSQARTDHLFQDVGSERGELLKRYGLTITAGVSVNGSSYPTSGNDPGVLKTGAVSGGIFDPTSNKAVEDLAEVERLRTPARAGSIIVNRANTPDLVGTGAFVGEDCPNLYLSDLLWEVRVERISPEFVSAWMRTRAYRDAIDLVRVGASSSMQKISQESFGKLRVPDASPAQQQQIVSAVADQDQALAAALADIDRAITLAKERRAALITAAVTGQIDVTQKRRPAAEQLEDELAD